MIEELKRRNSIGNDDIVMKVGDTVADVFEGKNAGCHYVIAVTTGATTREELEEHFPTHIISSLSEIPKILSQSIQYA
jgi:phosphoglycolate phosphatase-like HAD superfamily hydrolase